MNTDAAIKQVEQDALQVLTDRMRTGELTEDHAKEIAAFVLQSLKPHMTIDELWNVAKNFEHHFPELTKAAIDVNYAYTKELRQHILKQADILIGQQKIAEANSLLEAAIKQEHDIAANAFPHEPNNPSGDANTEKALADLVKDKSKDYEITIDQ